MSENHTSSKAVAFSGHRSFKANPSPDLFLSAETEDDILGKLAPIVRETVAGLYAGGYRRFLCGMAEGFDLLAAEAVMWLKRQYGDVELVAVIPHPGQANRYDEGTRSRYDAAMVQADSTVTISEAYSADCFHRRNDYLVDNSGVLVCFFNGTKGGTAYTVRRARRAGHIIVNLFGI